MCASEKQIARNGGTYLNIYIYIYIYTYIHTTTHVHTVVARLGLQGKGGEDDGGIVRGVRIPAHNISFQLQVVQVSCPRLREYANILHVKLHAEADARHANVVQRP